MSLLYVRVPQITEPKEYILRSESPIREPSVQLQFLPKTIWWRGFVKETHGMAHFNELRNNILIVFVNPLT